MNTYQAHSAYVLLQDGTVFYGKSVGLSGTSIGEVCFNTGMTGYQEIFTDPSYFGQIMVTTNAHIGNYAVLHSESESDGIKIKGLVCRNFTQKGSRSGKDEHLIDFFKENNTLAISDVDTRALVRHIRKNGAMNALLSTEVEKLEEHKKMLSQAPSMKGLELSSKVSSTKAYFFGDENATYRIAAIDFGIKKNILRSLAERDCYIKVFPSNATAKEIQEWDSHAYFFSNGPGDPGAMMDSLDTIKALIQEGKPTFGICLGHQLIALASGLSTFKMHHGHRGINHPIMNIDSGKGEISSQNHGFAVVKHHLEQHSEIELTHEHLNDNTVAGLRLKNYPCFSVQYHPEAAPGPNDAKYLFDEFIDLIKKSL